jgi:hypothetical protein
MWLPDVTNLHHASPDEGCLPKDRKRDARALKHRDHAGHLQPRDTGNGRDCRESDGGGARSVTLTALATGRGSVPEMS